ETTAIGQCREQLVNLGCEGVLDVVACAVEPPDLPGALHTGQRVQHREDRGGSYSGADQYDRARPFAQHEVPPRSGGVHEVAHVEAFMEVATAGAVALDADSIAALISAVRQ